MSKRLAERAWLRRGLFLAGNGGALVAAYLVIVDPLLATVADRARVIAEDSALLARYGSVAAKEDMVRALAERAKDDADKGGLLAGADEGAVNAGLQARLKQLAEAAGARLRTVRTLPAARLDKSQLVGARIEIAASIAVVRDTLQAIESQTPYLFVLSAMIRPIEAKRSGLPQEPLLEATLDVYGAWRGSGAGE